ncbi:MAG: hypothetical protein OXL97_01110 [Chloroflexota bacterium]|nr:hypothetical protein [Chloroflexota bacterium]MDE2884332.1 hypothetical protein [Chloroflexota bacterium]
MGIDVTALAALTERAGFTDRSDRGRLWIAGADALDLLNRLTTNKLETLPDGTARSTVLTNGDARVLDHLRLAAVDGGMWCLTSPGRAEDVADWTDLYTFGEEITVADRSEETAQFTVAGPLAGDALARAGFPVPPPDGVLSVGDGAVVASPFGTHPAYDILLPLAAADGVGRSLREIANEVDAATFDAYRIAQGVPAYDSEFGAFNNPLEARLLGSISDDKGCYTGQEVIARLQTYRKVQRLLMSFTSDAPAVAGDALEAEDGSPAGAVTSAFDTGDGRTRGLALVAAKHLSADSSLRLAGGGSLTLSEPAYALATEPVEA